MSEGKLKLFLHDLKDFGVGRHKRVDDKPFGGAKGMLLKPEPIFFALQHIKKKFLTTKAIIFCWIQREKNIIMIKL